jgi:hypothetical protein
MITVCNNQKVNGYIGMEFGDKIKLVWGLFLVKQIQPADYFARTYVLRDTVYEFYVRTEEATYIVRSYIYGVVL